MNKKKEFTFLWLIENYSYCWHRTEEKLISPEFTHDGLEGTAWTLELYPRGDDEDQGLIIICLRRTDENEPNAVTVTFDLAIVAEDGSTLFSKNDTTEYFLNGIRCGYDLAKMDEILSQGRAEYLPNDIMTVRCKLFIDKQNADIVAPIWAQTRIGIERISFLHIIDGFSALIPNVKKIYNIYSANQPRHVESCMYISDSEQKLMVEIKPSKSRQILAKCEIYLLDSSGKKIKCSEADNRFDVDRKEIQKLPLSLTKDEILLKESEYLPNDKLSLLCECIFSTGIEYQKIEGIQNSQASTVQKLLVTDSSEQYTNIFKEKLLECPSALADLIGIYRDKFLTDVVLNTKSNSFPAHKLVLCARSPVFKAMLSKDMKEKNSGSILVDDLEDETVKKLLNFLYSDSVDNLQWEIATKLYYAADKYEIKKLRLICSSFLMDKLTATTATELLVLAYTHSDNDLRKVVENFILVHDIEVFISNEWKELMAKNPLLAVKTMHLKYENNDL